MNHTEPEPRTDMPHIMSMFDRDYLAAFDLPQGRDAVVTISKVECVNLRTAKGGSEKKPLLHFEGKEKGLVCNKTNAKTIAQMYGPRTEAWIGKRVALYATTTQVGSETRECIRVRPQVPAQEQAPRHNPETGEVHG